MISLDKIDIKGEVFKVNIFPEEKKLDYVIIKDIVQHEEELQRTENSKFLKRKRIVKEVITKTYSNVLARSCSNAEIIDIINLDKCISEDIMRKLLDGDSMQVYEILGCYLNNNSGKVKLDKNPKNKLYKGIQYQVYELISLRCIEIYSYCKEYNKNFNYVYSFNTKEDLIEFLDFLIKRGILDPTVEYYENVDLKLVKNLEEFIETKGLWQKGN